MQIPLRTQSTVGAYIANREWCDADLPNCPLHPLGGCSFARHGTYRRVTPQGLRIARWYCPEGHQTFSLLPDFLAARLPGLLAAIEVSVAAASSFKSMEAAADAMRGLDVSLPGAVRWLRRRVRAVRDALDAVKTVIQELPIVTLATDLAPRIDRDQEQTLLGLRSSLSPQILNLIPPPLGFGSSQYAVGPRAGDQHGMGPDGGTAAQYGRIVNRITAPCSANHPAQSAQRPRPPPTTCFESGAPIAACKTTQPRNTFSGSGVFAPIA